MNDVHKSIDRFPISDGWGRREEHYYSASEPVNCRGIGILGVIGIDEDQFNDPSLDIPALFAEEYGVSKSDYLRWLEEDGGVRCGHTKKNGKRCKHYLAGRGPGSTVPVEWLKMESSYCFVHEGS